MSQLIARIVRRFATFKPQARPGKFDPAKEITSDVVVFKNEKSTKDLKLYFTLSICNCCFWLLPGYSGLRYLGDLSELSRRRKKYFEEGLCEKEYWEYLVDFMSEHKTIGFIILQISAFSGFFMVAIFAMRNIRRMALLKGGEKVNLQTWLPIPLKDYSHEMILPVKDISALNTRHSGGPFVRLKLKGFPFYFLMDKKNGEFTQPLIFDKTIAYERKFK